MRGTAGPWTAAPVTIDEPLAALLVPGREGAPAAVAARGARALLDLPAVSPIPAFSWLAGHQRPAAIRLSALLERYGGALLADAPGLGKSYVAMAVALMRSEAFLLVVPAVLVGQWRQLCGRFEVNAEIVTHEALSRRSSVAGAATSRGSASAADGGAAWGSPFHGQMPSRDCQSRRHPSGSRLLVVDEAHHFRNPATKRYRALAELAIGCRVLLVTATPVHNSVADVVHLLRLFLRDDALAGLGVPSLKRAAAGASWTELPTALSHLVVARSRSRAPSLTLPKRMRGRGIRVGSATDDRLERLVHEIASFNPGQAGGGGLMRMTLLTRLASSLPAFRECLARQEAFAEIAGEAIASGRTLTRRDFQRLFPRGEEPDLQLALLPMLLPEGPAWGAAGDQARLARLRALSGEGPDPKLARLDRLLTHAPARTIVFTASRATARYLLRWLKRRHRVALVMGAQADAPEVLAAFAPVATGSAPPPPALAVDVLIATDLASEGLNLQDASRVVNYDLPWTPARLAQRVGRIDRLGSPHARIETISLLPPRALARAVQIEARLLTKERAGRRTTPFDWCDRLQRLTDGGSGGEGSGSWVTVRGCRDMVLLVVSVGAIATPFVVSEDGVTGDPVVACGMLEESARADALPPDRRTLRTAISRAAPAIQKRLALLAASRWRAADRDQLSRRLIPMAVAAARKAAREGDGVLVGRLDQLVQRLGAGMTAGEELALAELVEGPLPLTAERLLAWSERLPANSSRHDTPEIRLEAAIVVRPGSPG